MKILKLTFENINSYEGRVVIDFTHPWFLQGNNQFVISGPMGAGKSTILDAITLALYGSTARLGRLTMSSTGNSGELINKRSGYCMSEVVYSCSKGIFESRFELHKARDKADGNIQKPQCTLQRRINDSETEKLIDRTTTDALQKGNEKIIGLTYDQFIRCILIPQGEFDSFLNSDDRDKARILARLSHTEHYREAAKKLNETASAISREYVNLQKVRDEIPVMSDDERKAGEDKKLKLKELVGKQEQELKELAEKISWLDQIAEAEEKLNAAGDSLNCVKAGQEQHEQDKKELDNAGKAADCDIEYQAFVAGENEHKHVQEEIENKEEKIQKQEEDLKKTEQDAKLRSGEYEIKKKEKEVKKTLWAEVRQLDTAVSVAGNAREEKERVFRSAKENLEGGKEKCAEYEKNIISYTNTIKELNEYLDLHKEDEALSESLTGYAEKIKTRKTAEEQLNKAVADEKEYQKKREKLLKDRETLIAKRDIISDELFKVVSEKYLLVAEILRRDLKPGSYCPVCGKTVGVEVDEQESSGNKEPAKERNETAMDISRLKDSLEETEGAIKEKEAFIRDMDKDIETAGQAAADARRTIEAFVSDLNGFLSPWGIAVDPDTSAAELEKMGKDLIRRKDAYKNKKDECDEKHRLLSETKAGLGAIDINKLQEAYAYAEAEFKAADEKYAKLFDLRKEKFADKSVDEEETEFDRELSIKEKANSDANRKLQDIRIAIKGLEGEIAVSKDREKKLVGELDSLKTAFKEKLEKCQFATKESFLSCRREKEYTAVLEERIKQFERKGIEANKEYQLAKSELEKLKKKKLTSESRDALKEKEEQLRICKSEKEQEIGGLTEKLEADDVNRKKWKEKDEKLREMGNEAEIYKRISEMLGKNDGTDFEVFVQGIAMKSLLEKANIYLQNIIPSYCLVQTSVNSVSFRVHERMGDGTVLARELKNFSGGEKFIISLSLALAMAEFAGQNGDVECIFLDEGFGTLSGEPLVEAVNALKKLSSTGKMLGIITHIDAVVNQFNRIVAEKRGERSILSCEKSVLSGDGAVTYTEPAKGKIR